MLCVARVQLVCTNKTTPGSVTKLVFSNETLSGTLGKEVEALSSLQVLIIERTNLTGQLQSVNWTKLADLRVLSLDANRIRGSEI